LSEIALRIHDKTQGGCLANAPTKSFGLAMPRNPQTFAHKVNSQNVVTRLESRGAAMKFKSFSSHTRRQVLQVAFALLAAPFSWVQGAAIYTQRLVRIVVPYRTGGSNDVLARIVHIPSRKAREASPVHSRRLHYLSCLSLRDRQPRPYMAMETSLRSIRRAATAVLLPRIRFKDNVWPFGVSI